MLFGIPWHTAFERGKDEVRIEYFDVVTFFEVTANKLNTTSFLRDFTN
jgi:hypothetical protein